MINENPFLVIFEKALEKLELIVPFRIQEQRQFVAEMVANDLKLIFLELNRLRPGQTISPFYKKSLPAKIEEMLLKLDGNLSLNQESVLFVLKEMIESLRVPEDREATDWYELLHNYDVVHTFEKVLNRLDEIVRIR